VNDINLKLNDINIIKDVDKSIDNKSSNSSFYISPELLSPNETLELIIEVLKKAQTSEELLDKLCNNHEFINFIHFISNYISNIK